jgi:hypothetical protein
MNKGIGPNRLGVPKAPAKSLKKVVKTLRKAVVAHKEQADIVEDHIKEMGGESPIKKKDACYRKAKAKYDVFPSAYASGYIAKCRKRGGKLG